MPVPAFISTALCKFVSFPIFKWLRDTVAEIRYNSPESQSSMTSGGLKQKQTNLKQVGFLVFFFLPFIELN